MKPLQVIKIVISSVIFTALLIALFLGAVYQQQYRSEQQLMRYTANE